MEPSNITELKRRFNRGEVLAEHEEEELKTFISTKEMSRQSFDFGEIAQRVNPGRLEEMGIREQNARWAKNGPSNKGGGYLNSSGFGGGLIRRDDCKPLPVSAQRDMRLPSSGDDIRRMLNKFFSKLAEVRETGKLI
ncbi:MAG: hypothetical protein AB2L12_17530 [Smithellaceae bacterium]